MAYLNESDIEDSDIELFKSLGYEHINAWREKLVGRESLKEVVLKDRLNQSLHKINKNLPQSAIDDAIKELTKSRVSLSEIEANQEVYSLIKEGVSVTYTDEKNREQIVKVKVIDFTDMKNNDFVVVSQLSIELLGSNRNRRPDLILYVNGLPLVMLELKNAKVKIKTGYDDNLQTYREEIPQLFYYNLFVVISNGIQTRVGSFIAPWEHFFPWAKLEDNVVEKKSQEEKPKLSLEICTKGLCSKENLTDYCENFVLYHRKKTKIIAKNHQFLGVNRAIDSFKNRDGTGQLGVFWHTQGSGKSYSMIFFTKKLNRTVTGNHSFLILTDRNDLDDQIFRNFLDTETFSLGANDKQDKNPFRAKGQGSRKQLEVALTQNKSFYFSTIFNFGIAKGKTYTQKSDRDDWIVIVDEAHRSQYNGFGENIKIALPNAQYLAFTGTPILKNRLTKERFGSYISEYNFAQSIEDGATVPLYYKKSVPRVEQINEDLVEESADILDKYDLNDEQRDKLDREYSTLFEIVKRDDRLDEVAKHIVEHFPARLNVRDTEGNQTPMKAMIISIDKFTALRMYDKVQLFVKQKIIRLRKEIKREVDKDEVERKKQTLDFLLETKMAVVISQEGSDREEEAKFSEKGLDIKPHRKLMQNPDEDGRDIEDYFKDPSNPYRIVFVTAMWMTGFDAPATSTLYLDKPMKNHTLMQTIARVNRVFEGKQNGLIIDYFGVFRNLRKALNDYGEGSKGSSSEDDMPVKDFDKLLELLEQSILECTKYLLDIDIDIEKIREIKDKSFTKIELFNDFAEIVLENDKRRGEYNLFVNTISSLYDSAKPEVYNDVKLKEYRDLFLYLKDVVNRKRDRDKDVEEVKKELDALLDSSIGSKGDLEETTITINSGSEIELGKIDFEQLKKEFPKKKRKNTEFTDLKEFMALKLKQMLAKNKTRGEFLERFEDIIDEYNNGSIEVEEAYSKLILEAQKMTSEQERYIKEGFSNEEELELFDMLKKDKLNKEDISKVKKASIELLQLLRTKKAELFVYNWHKEKQKTEKVQHEILEVLDKTLPLSYDKDIFSEKKEEIYGYIHHLAESGDKRFIVTK